MKKQFIPLLFAVVAFITLSVLLFVFARLLNLFPLQSKIILTLRPIDIFVGLTIYVKTAIDFALFIGSLMHRHVGVKNRIAIELGTTLGNGIGTFLILILWIFFKETPVLLTIMILIASLVLLRMAEDGLREYQMSNTTNFKYPIINYGILLLEKILQRINKVFDPILGKLLPHPNKSEKKHTNFWSLFLFALTIPLLLGLDDFAGYIPLFSLVNVIGFAVGVFLGHMLLTASLFAFPQKTTRFVRQPIILLLGSLVFVGLSLFGILEVGQSLFKILK